MISRGTGGDEFRTGLTILTMFETTCYYKSSCTEFMKMKMKRKDEDHLYDSLLDFSGREKAANGETKVRVNVGVVRRANLL